MAGGQAHFKSTRTKGPDLYDNGRSQYGEYITLRPSIGLIVSTGLHVLHWIQTPRCGLRSMLNQIRKSLDLSYISAIPGKYNASSRGTGLINRYSPTLYHAVGRVFGNIDLAAIPIGSYEPRWHMHLQHTDPEGAVNMAKFMNVKKSVGVHWGTWIMSDELCKLRFSGLGLTGR